MKVFLFVFLLHLDTHRAAFGIPIYEGESIAAREDDVLAQQDVKRNEGEKRYKRFCSLVPFDVQCHGRCPYDENEWNSVRSSWNCANERVGATYHCTDPEDDSGDPIEACGIPKYCDKGKGPVISFPKGHSKTADIDCNWCPEDYFNPSESIRSDNVSKCQELRNDCGRHGLIECDKVTGVERHWTDSKCECDIKNNYFPLDGENKCTVQSLHCFWNQPCKKSPEGFDQIYIFSVSKGKYVCQRGCKEGFEFKTSQSKECEPVQVDRNSTRFENETTIYNSSSTMLLRTTTTGSYTTTTETKPNTTAKIVNDAAKADNNEGAIALYIIIFGILGSSPIVYLCIGCYKYRNKITSGANDDHKGRYKIVNRERVSASRYILCWPCYKVVLPTADETVELHVGLPPADENAEQHVDMPPADEDVELKVDLPPAVVPPVAARANVNVLPQVDLPRADENGPQVAEPAYGNVVPQVAAPANGNVVPQDDLQPADENVPQDDGQHNLTTGSDEPKESLPHIGDNPAIGNETIVDVKNPLHLDENLVDINQTERKVSAYVENQPQRRNKERRDLPQPAADERSSNQRVLEPQGKQHWIDELSEDVKQKNASDFYRLHEFIGKGWQEFAECTGLSVVNIEHIEMETKNSYTAIKKVLQKLYQCNECDEVTLLDVLHILKKCPINTSINWKGLKLYIKSNTQSNQDNA